VFGRACGGASRGRKGIIGKVGERDGGNQSEARIVHAPPRKIDTLSPFSGVGQEERCLGAAFCFPLGT
jgi:hypothetical protein